MNSKVMQDVLFWVDKGIYLKTLIKFCMEEGNEEQEIISTINALIKDDTLVKDNKTDWIVCSTWMPRTAAKIRRKNENN